MCNTAGRAKGSVNESGTGWGSVFTQKWILMRLLMSEPTSESRKEVQPADRHTLSHSEDTQTLLQRLWSAERGWRWSWFMLFWWWQWCQHRWTQNSKRQVGRRRVSTHAKRTHTVWQGECYCVCEVLSLLVKMTTGFCVISPFLFLQDLKEWI